MNTHLKTLFFLLIILICNSTYADFEQSDKRDEYKKVYILKHRWHTGIIINRNESKELLTALGNDFSQSEYIEIGWGDKDFYMAENETFWLTLKAVLWPTKSVLHVAEIKNHPLLLFNEDEIIELNLKKDDYKKLINYINTSFCLNKNGENEKPGIGLYGHGQFYLSNEKYHLFKTCNVWTAKGLKKAQIPINPYFAFTSKNVMKQLKRKSG